MFGPFEVRPDTGLSNGKLGVWLFLAIQANRGAPARDQPRRTRYIAGSAQHIQIIIREGDG